MSHQPSRPTPARRLFTRLGSFDPDLGPYTGHPDDPRYVGPSVCPECGGGKRGPDGERCEFCGGTGQYWSDDE